MKKIIKKLSICAAFILVIVWIGACSKSNSIIGTWNYYKDGDVSDDIYYKFDKGDKGSYTYGGSTKEFKYEDRGNKVIITYEGNTSSNEFDYTISDGILTIKDSFGSDVTYKRK